jgi:hypothetical protein
MEANMLGARQIVDRKPTPYATSANFCRIFQEDMSRLYLLSLLLTADREKAEQCFVSGLEDSVEASPVFKEWARSWARRTIIQNALRLVKPRPVGRNGHSISAAEDREKFTTAERIEIAAVLELRPFERFVYVMSVLERYSDQDCAVLLACGRSDVKSARVRALQQIGTSMALHHPNQPSPASAEEPVEQRASHERCRSVLELLIAPDLATSA